MHDRNVEAHFYSRFTKTTVIQIQAPTNDTDEETEHVFCDQLQKIVDRVPRHDMLLVIGDWSAKVGEQQVGEEGILTVDLVYQERDVAVKSASSPFVH